MNNKLQSLHVLESKNLFPELIMMVIIRTFLAQTSTPPDNIIKIISLNVNLSLAYPQQPAATFQL